MLRLEALVSEPLRRAVNWRGIASRAVLQVAGLHPGSLNDAMEGAICQLATADHSQEVLAGLRANVSKQLKSQCVRGVLVYLNHDRAILLARLRQGRVQCCSCSPRVQSQVGLVLVLVNLLGPPKELVVGSEIHHSRLGTRRHPEAQWLNGLMSAESSSVEVSQLLDALLELSFEVGLQCRCHLNLLFSQIRGTSCSLLVLGVRHLPNYEQLAWARHKTQRFVGSATHGCSAPRTQNP
mmetsp:Transcript_99820/g.229138  ORF Transcript_99820/g.229138 Transcript_99820/m.229138 type:complete len:238 (+) Transcript_99820:324-1037(+)